MRLSNVTISVAGVVAVLSVVVMIAVTRAPVPETSAARDGALATGPTAPEESTNISAPAADYGFDPTKIDIYVTPYFDSRGPQINVGTFSAGLSADGEEFVQTIHDMKASWDTLPVEPMYVAAIRLYDLGYLDEAVYFFYSAQSRAMFIRKILDEKGIGGIGSEAFERMQAWNAFQQLAGTAINGYAFAKPDQLEAIVRRVAEESKALCNHEPVYPTLAMTPRSEWPAKCEELNRNTLEFADFISQSATMIAQHRKDTGIDQVFDSLTSIELPELEQSVIETTSAASGDAGQEN